MDHSVRSYLQRMPIDKLNTLFAKDFFEAAYAINDVILQDILEVLLSRNSEPGSHLFSAISKIQEMQSNRNRSEYSIEY